MSRDDATAESATGLSATTATAGTATTAATTDLSAVLIPLLKGVTYRTDDAAHWSVLLQLQGRVRDHAAVLGLVLKIGRAHV